MVEREVFVVVKTYDSENISPHHLNRFLYL